MQSGFATGSFPSRSDAQDGSAERSSTFSRTTKTELSKLAACCPASRPTRPCVNGPGTVSCLPNEWASNEAARSAAKASKEVNCVVVYIGACMQPTTDQAKRGKSADPDKITLDDATAKKTEKLMKAMDKKKAESLPN